MHKFLQAAPTHGCRHTPGWALIVLTLAALFLVSLLAPAIHVAAAARAGDLARGTQALSLTYYLFITVANAVPSVEKGLVSFVLALTVTLPLVGVVEQMWRSCSRPGSRL